jgi:O-acetyl-ADP-ribose deacetylase (regulator of RNase III)
VHVCNDVGAWGAGFVVALLRRRGEPEAADKTWYRNRKRGVEPPFELGSVQFVAVADQLWVANMIGQRNIRRSRKGEPPVRYHAIATGLGRVADYAQANQATAPMPRIGAGLAGGDWTRIEAVINETLGAVEVTVYDLPTT